MPILTSDDEVVSYSDIDRAECRDELLGDPMISGRRFRTAGRMVVGEDHRVSLVAQRNLNRRTRLDVGTIRKTFGHEGRDDDSALGVETDHVKDLLRSSCHERNEELGGAFARCLRMSLQARTGHGVAACQRGHKRQQGRCRLSYTFASGEIERIGLEHPRKRAVSSDEQMRELVCVASRYGEEQE